MAIVQKTATTVNAATTVNPSLAGVTAGNTLVFAVGAFSATTDNTPTDSSTQTWSKACYLTNTGAIVACYYLLSANAGTHTLTYSAGGASSFLNYGLLEIPACSALDVVGAVGTAVNTATTLTTPSITTTNANDAIIAIFSADAAGGVANSGITDPPSGYTSIYAQQATNANEGAEFCYKEVTSTGSQAVTWTFALDGGGSWYAGVILSFNQSGAGSIGLMGQACL